MQAQKELSANMTVGFARFSRPVSKKTFGFIGCGLTKSRRIGVEVF